MNLWTPFAPNSSRFFGPSDNSVSQRVMCHLLLHNGVILESRPNSAERRTPSGSLVLADASRGVNALTLGSGRWQHLVFLPKGDELQLLPSQRKCEPHPELASKAYILSPLPKRDHPSHWVWPDGSSSECTRVTHRFHGGLEADEVQFSPPTRSSLFSVVAQCLFLLFQVPPYW